MVDVAGLHPGAEGQRGDDGRLGSGVEALYVGGWVALGVAQALGLCQSVGVAGPLVGHASQDEIGRAVNDSHDPSDRLAGQRLA